ncbi:MAG: hypothetical protein Q4D89_06825 [Arachnia propionica]|uniref:hypothetical protein n=1 Tax=Arachnia propionica TaxID=1750 RepID=UPI0027105257|nr:hypothetical protein [Arachnia propionica]
MTEFHLGGPITSALTHFAGYGLAAILEDQGHTSLRMHWQESESPSLVITGVSEQEVGDAVQGHASAISPNHWINGKLVGEPRDGASLFSPRIKAAGSRKELDPRLEWETYAEQRNRYLTADLSRLDRSMIHGLGEPAHWHHTDKDNQPDRGASRWEMKTRNRGEEMVTHRIRPLLQAIRSRSGEELAAGLAGRQLVDLNTKADSRTSSGFTKPGPVDCAVAWCALWGISWMPTVHLVHSMSQSPGVTPRTRVHPSDAALPLATSPMSPALWQVVLRSRQLDVAAFHLDDAEARTSMRWLHARGVIGLVRFGIHLGGSAAAPERHLLDGTLDLFEVDFR